VLAFGELTVTGKVVYTTGVPAPNFAVVVAGRGPFVSDGSGEFVVTNVPVPYDAIVFNGPAGRAAVWRGLTRPDPTFTIEGPLPPSVTPSMIDGKVSGGAGLPVPPNHETQLGFGVEDGLAFASATPDPVTGLYAVSSFVWLGPFSTTLHVTALQYAVDLDGLPTTFTGYGTIPAPILVGDTLMNQDIVMGPVATTTLSGTVATAPGITAFVRLVFLDLPGNGFAFLPTDVSPSVNFSLKAPDAPGVGRAVLVEGVDTGGNMVIAIRRNLPAPATGVNLSIPASTGLAFPVDGATGVGYSTAFQVTASPGDRVFAAEFRPNVGSGPQITVYTTSSTFTIPDLSAYGLGLPAGTLYSWSVEALGPASSVDDAAVPQSLIFFLQTLGGDDVFQARTDTWDFTFGS